MEQDKKIAIRTYDRELPAQFARIALAELGIVSELKNCALPENRHGAQAEKSYSVLVPWDEAIIADNILSRSETCGSICSEASSEEKQGRRWKELSGFLSANN